MQTITTKTLAISSAFSDHGAIPSQYTCDGAGINPEIRIRNIPDHTRSLALIVDDPDAPKGNFVHWLMWNIPVTDRIEEDSTPGAQGANSNGDNKYMPPCPPSGSHRYHFKVYALDTRLDLPRNTTRNALVQAMKGHILAEGQLVGLYKK